MKGDLKPIEWENIVVNVFDDGTIDVQTYIDIDEVNDNEELALRDCFQINPDGTEYDIFPFWNI